MGTEWTERAAVLDRWSGISDFKAANVRCIRLSSEPLVFRAYIPKHKHAHMWVQTCRKVARCRLLRTFRKGVASGRCECAFWTALQFAHSQRGQLCCSRLSTLNLSSNQMSSEEASGFLSCLLSFTLLRFIVFTLRLECTINVGRGF